MAKAKWHSPQLSREIVFRLCVRAKTERIPMTVLANRLMEEALESQEKINTQIVADNQHITEPS
jgi:hypothetical protein